MKPSGIGGQAVMEGIMMMNKDHYAVAVRKPNGEIEVKVEEHTPVIKYEVLTKIPFVRGVFNFVDSLVTGMKCLTYSASFVEAEEEAKPENLGEEEAAELQKKKEKEDSALMTGTVILSILMAVGIFMILPYFLSSLLTRIGMPESLVAVAEAVLRIAIFLAYILLISKMEDIQRVFMYHGAEHKCINCVEHGLELTVDNVLNSSKEHKRCGTSFLMYVVLISVIFFLFIRVESHLLRLVIRICLVPVIAGVAYEFIRLAGRSTNPLVNLLSKPGLLLQRLTTREPDAQMAEVAIAAVEAVCDWRAFLKENFGDEHGRKD